MCPGLRICQAPDANGKAPEVFSKPPSEALRGAGGVRSAEAAAELGFLSTVRPAARLLLCCLGSEREKLGGTNELRVPYKWARFQRPWLPPGGTCPLRGRVDFESQHGPDLPSGFRHDFSVLPCATELGTVHPPVCVVSRLKDKR